MQHGNILRSALALVFVLGCSASADGPVGTTSTSNGGAQSPVIGRAGENAPVSRNAQPQQQQQPDAAAPSPTTISTKQSLVWLWNDYANSLAAIVAHPSSFTHVSPAFY